MGDTSSSSSRATALEAAHLLEDHNAEGTLVLHVGDVCSWTDYFVIATARSTTHLRSLLDYVLELLKERSVKPLNPARGAAESGWALVDCGGFVVHLMERDKRDFYELEKLWFMAEEVYSSSSASSVSSSES
jgi:ribosome-associated protein